MGKKGTNEMARKIDDLFGSSRFVLPEQREMYLQMKRDDKLVPKPILEPDELESFNYLIRDSGREGYAVTVTWWKPVKGNLGEICSMWGIVKWVDQHARRIKLVNDEESQWIDLDKITAVSA